MDAMAALRGNEDLLETLNTLFLVDAEERLAGAIPLARLFVASGGAKLKDLATETLIQVTVDEKQDRVTELFDKYNLLTLPVVDEDGKLAGVITADDIISVLEAEVTDAEIPEPLPLPPRGLLRRARARASSPPSSITMPAASSPTRRRARSSAICRCGRCCRSPCC